MCSEYVWELHPDLADALYDYTPLPDSAGVKHHVRITNPAPVFVKENLRLMRFGLLPSWSKEPKVKFATHNARLDTIEEKATWRTPFKRNHCLVPMGSFLEPIYTGEYAGNIVGFKAKNDEPLVAAGIYDTWINKETGEVIDSFAIITHDPPKYVADIGHDRCPLFLKKSVYKEWLELSPDESGTFKAFLEGNQALPEFKVEISRELKNKKATMVK